LHRGLSAGFGENGNVRYVFLQNLSTAEPLYVNFGGTATVDNSFKLEPGICLVFEHGFVPSDAITVLGTAGHKFVAKRG
jgi:hypothetical protein